MEWMDSPQFIWGWILTITPIVVCIALYCWMASRGNRSAR